LEKEAQQGSRKIDEKMSYRGMHKTCSGFGTGRLQQEIRRSGGRRLGRKWPKNGPKRHRIRTYEEGDTLIMTAKISQQKNFQ
jgi:hypothetical protein